MAVAGKVAITPKGEWNANTAYTKLDLVFYENASYVAIQPSTGVEPTNTSYWMLVVQSAGGADLEAIINGTTQVGNAKTLDGHEAEYFLSSSGGTIDGNVTVMTTEEKDRVVQVQNLVRSLGLYVQSSGAGGIRDNTNGKWVVYSTIDGTNTFNGAASGNLPITGGRLKKAEVTILDLESTVSNNNRVMTGFYANNELYGHLGFEGKDNPTFHKTDGNYYSLLHTGNKPNGSYTGNGSATARTIKTGGIGYMAIITSSSGVAFATPYGALKISGGSVSWLSANQVKYINGDLTTATDDSVINSNNDTKTYYCV